MNDSPLLPPPLWPFLVARPSPIARRSVVFLPPWISQRSRHCVRCFSKIWLCELVTPFHQGDCGIVWVRTGWLSTLMAPNKPHDNEPFPLLPSFPLPIDVLTGSVLLPISGASEGRSLAPARRCCRLTPTTGWAPSAERAMGTIGEN